MLASDITNFNVRVAAKIQRQAARIEHIIAVLAKCWSTRKKTYTTQNLHATQAYETIAKYSFHYKTLLYQKWIFRQNA